MKPNVIGPKILYLNPSDDVFTTAQLAAIDTAYWPVVGNYSPYAKSATVRDDYDTGRFLSDTAATSNIAGKMRNSFGLFLSADNNKKNLLWQLSGSIYVSVIDTIDVTQNLRTSFFFGRKATNDTVTSSKSAVSNTLEKVMTLPAKVLSSHTGPLGATSGNGNSFYASIESELFSLEEAGKFVYCFGASIDNTGSDALPCVFDISLSLRKFVTPMFVYNTERP